MEDGPPPDAIPRRDERALSVGDRAVVDKDLHLTGSPGPKVCAPIPRTLSVGYGPSGTRLGHADPPHSGRGQRDRDEEGAASDRHPEVEPRNEARRLRHERAK